jgi:O-phospho-L-seryl-tRNASec:L-selenocysteinyl-tRNA synthase
VVVPLGKSTPIGGCDFVNWGAHHGAYPVPYFTAACSIGLTASEIDLFMERLDAVWKKFDKRRVGAVTGGRST